jgi:hypothetical protein
LESNESKELKEEKIVEAEARRNAKNIKRAAKD